MQAAKINKWRKIALVRSQFYVVLAEVVYIAKLTNKYILVKYNCTGKFSGSICCLYNKTGILRTRVVYER